MAQTHDGLQTPLPPSRTSQLVGLAILAGGVAIAVWYWWCAALPVLLIGALVLGNQLGGVTRVRVTFSKLLVEDERPVMGFLIGPSKRRIPWEEFEAVEVVGGQVVARGKGTVLELGKGSPEPELAELARKITEAAQRYRTESA